MRDSHSSFPTSKGHWLIFMKTPPVMITPVEKELEDEPGVLAKGRMLSVRGEPLLLADWDRAAFLHFEVDPGVLRQSVPYPLDLYDGRAFVSLVTFTMRRLRCVRAQRLT